ncbi:MAG: site-specific integrase [Prochloraceae cyanobacterium]|nr:site-specific integrase [Prochloraceae cyanobacterium]
MSPKRKYSAISVHETMLGTLKVEWEQQYKREFNCPSCNQGQITKYEYRASYICNLALFCNSCDRRTSLACRLPIYVFNYRPEIECPNLLCTGIGQNGQKGWVYFRTKNNYQCHFCKINFNPNSTSPMSWVVTQAEEKLSPFVFDEDIWQLGHFYKNPKRKTVNFQSIHPVGYRQKVKKYIHYLLKSQVHSSSGRINYRTNTLRQFGKSMVAMKIERLNEIERSTINHFLDTCKSNSNTTINDKLAQLRDFLDWHNIETPYLIRSRDFLKISKNAPDWLDEVTRQGIKKHLDKIPAPIVRHYLVQSYLAARPGDVCRLPFDCLVEENGKWYIKFFQSKTQRWHKIFANRKIRKVIEEQQQWIRKSLGKEYAYLFCHFRSIKQVSYPTFSSIKPLLKPPSLETHINPMVRIIRMLIDKENVLDANGQKPHFTGEILRSSRLQEVRTKYGMEAARLYANHKSSTTTFQHYAPPTREQIAKVDLPFQELLLNPDNKFLPWQSIPESLLKNPKAHELDLEIAPRLVVYGHCALDPKTPCPVKLFPKCYGCFSFRPSTGKLPLYERQYQGEQQRLTEAEKVDAELALEEAKATIEAMDKWLPELRRLANG